MKIRVMSKLSQNESLPSSNFYRTANTNPLTLRHAPNSLSSHSDYFPGGMIPQKKRHMQPSKTKVADFFQRFHIKCNLTYERVELKAPQLCRKLAPMLEALNCPTASTPLKDEYQFSFKKTQDTSSVRHNCSDYPTPPAQQQDTASNYYLHAANKPKIKLRKFHSLISIKKDCSPSLYDPHPHIVRRNHSLVKKQSNIIRLFQAKLDKKRNYTENEEEEKQAKGRECVRTEVFEDEKERLNRIRKELNQIYHAKRGPSEIRLRLY